MILTLSLVAIFSLVLACSGGEDLPTQVSGTWQRSEGGGTVEIDLVNKPPQLTVDGQAYPATIEKIDKGSGSVYLTVQTEDGQEEWILHQRWNDNGSAFKLALIHNGVHENLVSAKQS
jgi:hypothetical protein